MNFIEAQRKVVESQKTYYDSRFSNALKGNKSGEAVTINDVSPLEHEMSVRVSSKNLFAPFIASKTFTFLTAVTVAVEKDSDIVTINGTATQSNGRTASWDAVEKSIMLKGGVTYALSINVVSGTASSLNVYVKNMNDNSWFGKAIALTNALTITPDTDTEIILCPHLSNGVTYDNLQIQLQVEVGTTATAYTPYVPDVTAITINKTGKQILDTWCNYSNTIEGLTVTSDVNGIFTINGTCTALYASYIQVADNMVLPAGTYAISGSPSTATTGTYFFCCFDVADRTVNLASDYYGTGAVFTIEKETEISFKVYVAKGVEMKDVVFKPQLEVGSVATSYEPYVDPTTYSVNPDGTVEGITSLYPSTTLMTDTPGALIECEYNRDLNKAFAELTQAIISLGGNI